LYIGIQVSGGGYTRPYDGRVGFI